MGRSESHHSCFNTKSWSSMTWMIWGYCGFGKPPCGSYFMMFYVKTMVLGYVPYPRKHANRGSTSACSWGLHMSWSHQTHLMFVWGYKPNNPIKSTQPLSTINKCNDIYPGVPVEKSRRLRRSPTSCRSGRLGEAMGSKSKQFNPQHIWRVGLGQKSLIPIWVK